MSDIIQSSLIQFSVSNFKCFKDRVDFSMVARQDSGNNFEIPKIEEYLLKSSIIFGPNASGKSSLLEAIDFMRKKILSSTNNEHIEKLAFSEFFMEEGYDKKPSFFEIIFVVGNTTYRYNFSLMRDHTVVEENLYKVNKTSEKELFTRKSQKISMKDAFSKDEELKTRTKETYLFLSVCDTWNVKIAEEIGAFFMYGMAVLQGYGIHKFSDYTKQRLQKESSFKAKVLQYLSIADFSMKDVQTKEEKIDIPAELKEIIGDKHRKRKRVIFIHEKFDNNGNVVGNIEIDEAEQSTGTMNFFNELGPIIDTLEKGKILFIDELDASLHPDLCDFIIRLFHSQETNPYNAQLIFTSHNYRLLESIDTHRDQFWFTERDKFGASKLFSLAEFKERKTSDFYKKYFEGRFGARPFIDNNF